MSKKKNIVRKFFKGLGIVILILLLLLLCLRIPAVQTKLGKFATQRLSKQLETKVSVDKIAINFIDNANLKGIYIEDRQGDTLLYAGNLNVELGFWKLLSKQIEIEDIILENAVVNVNQGPDSLYNFQFLLDKFASDGTTTDTPSELKISLNTLSGRNIRAKADFLDANHALKLASLAIDFEDIDLDKSEFNFDYFIADQLEINSHILTNEEANATTNVNKESAPLAFPLQSLPFSISASEVSIQNSRISYQLDDAQDGAYFNAGYSNVTNLNFQMNDLELDSNHVSSKISRFDFFLNDKFILNEMNSEFILTANELILKSLEIHTAESDAKIQSTVNFKSFDDLVNKLDQLLIDFNVEDLNLSLPELSYFIEEIDKQSDLMAFRKDRLNLKGQAKGSLKRLDLNAVKASISKTSLSINGRISNLLETDNIGFKNLKLKLSSPHRDFRNFISDPTLKVKSKRLGLVVVDGVLDGKIDKVNLVDMKMKTDAILQGQIDGVITNVMDTKKLGYNIRIKDITSGGEDLKIFMDSIPDVIAKFDTMNYSGNISGDLHDISMLGDFKTTLGSLNTDLAINFNDEYENAVYKGKLDLISFDLGELLDNDSLGITSMKLDFDGSGLSMNDVKTNLDAKISVIEFNRYEYKDIDIDGFFEENKFNGKASIKDENISFDFDGKIDMNDSIPAFAFNFELDTINLEKLNLIDESYRGKLKMEANFTGLDLDLINGQVVLHDINFWNKDKQIFTDSMILDASRSSNTRLLSFDSDYLKAQVEGNFDLSLLPDVILDFLDQYFPLKQFIGMTPKEDEILDKEEFVKVKNDNVKLNVNFNNLGPIFSFFEIPVSKMDTSFLSFNLDSPKNLSNFEAYIPTLVYDGYFFDSIYTSASNNDQQALKGVFSIDSVGIAEAINLRQVDLAYIFKEQKARFDVSILSSENFEGLGFVNEIRSMKDGGFTINFIENLVLKNKPWKIETSDPITVKDKNFEIPVIRVANGNESFTITGNNSEIDFDFNRFNLSNIVEIVGIDSLEVLGSMNGPLNIGLESDLPLTSNLQINNIEFNEYKIGDLKLDANKSGDQANAILKLAGQEAALESIVNYDLSNGDLSGDIDLQKLNLAPFEPLLTSYFSKVKGTLSGKLNVTGNLGNPIIIGDIYFNDVSAYVKDLSTDYKIKSGSFRLSDGLIEPDITLADEKDRLSFLKGKITHNYFQDLKLDLNFDAKEFTFLNSVKNRDEYFYGKLVGKVNAKITGDLELPFIDADVTALNETNMTIQLLSSEAVLTEEDYIIFYDGNKTNGELGLDSIANISYNTKSTFDLKLRLNTNSDAAFHVIIDPITGDRLDIKGNSTLLVKMPRNEPLSIVGEYVVSSGNYRVSYENTIRRDFAIQKDSKIVFQGDPTLAQLKLETMYKTKISTAPLTSLSSSISQEEISSGKEEVNVILNIDGTISNPVLEFDIQISEDDLSPIGSSVSTALSSLRQDETRLLEQVFSIILFNSFTGGSSGGNLNDLGTSTAVTSVGNLINGQLNKLAKNANGFEIDFGLDQYRNNATDNSNITEIDVGLSQRLFDDRLIISAGGNANLETGNDEGSNFASLAGDFVIQYILTKNGKYRIKVFQKSDFNALSNESVWKTGLGVTYKTKFGKVKPSKAENED